MKALITITLVLVFALGWMTSIVYTEAKFAGIESPAEFLNYTLNNSERISPSDTISEDQIWIYDDYAIINVPGLSLAKYADTNSMDPVLDSEANGLEIVPSSPDDIHVGDIVAYRYGEDEEKNLIVHRVVNKTVKDGKTIFTLQGDNNLRADQVNVSFDDIKYKLVGVLY